MKRTWKIASIVFAIVLLVSVCAVAAFATDTEHKVASYEELANAVKNAQNGDTIKLTADITTDATKTTAQDRLTVTKDITLDLGEYTIYVPHELEPTDNWAAIYVGDCTLTVEATTGGIYSGDDEKNGTYGFNVGTSSTAGTLIINGGNYYCGITTVQVTKGNLTINGGRFEVTDKTNEYGATFNINCIDRGYESGTSTIVVNGGTFVGQNPADVDSEPTNPTSYLGVDKAVAVNGNEYTVVDAVAKIGEACYASLTDAITAAQAGDTINVVAAEIELPKITKAGLTFKAAKDGTKITNEVDNTNSDGSWNLAGTTFEGFEFTQRLGLIGSDITLEGCKFTGYSGIYYGAASGTWTINNCEFNNTVYGLQVGEGGGTVNVTNSIISGFGTYGANVTVNFDNCTFVKGKGNYSILQSLANLTVTNSIFEAGWFDVAGAAVNAKGENTVIEFKNTDFAGKDVFKYYDSDHTGLIAIDADKNGDLYISGTFDKAPAAAKIAEGYVAVENDDGYFNVVSKVQQNGATILNTSAAAPEADITVTKSEVVDNKITYTVEAIKDDTTPVKDFVEGQTVEMTFEVPATVAAEEAKVLVTHTHEDAEGNQTTHYYIETVVNGLITIDNAVGFSDFTVTPEEVITKDLKPGDSLSYNGQTVTNNFATEITLTYFAKYDRYAIGEVSFTTYGGAAYYTGSPLKPEDFTFDNDNYEFYDTFAPAIISGTGSVGYFRLDQSKIEITNVGTVPNGSLEAITYDGQPMVDYFVVDTDKTSFGTLEVLPVELTEADVTVDDVTYTYNATEQTITITTVNSATVGGDAITYTFSTTYAANGEGYGAMPTFKNAGTYKVYWYATAPNHNTDEGEITVTVDKAKVTLTATADDIVYGTPSYTANGTVVGVMAGDDLNVVWTNTYTSTTTVAADAIISATYDEANTNYDVTVVDATLDVTPATITDVTIAQNGTLTYNAQNQTPVVDKTATAVNDMALTWKFSLTEGNYGEMPVGKNADTYTVYYEITADNHETYTGSFTFKIGKATVTITATADDIVYGTPSYTANGTVVGVMAGDDLNVVWTNTYTSTTTVTADATISATYDEENTNYDVTVVDATLDVTPATITDVTIAQNGTLTYNGTEQTPVVDKTATAVNEMVLTWTYSLTEGDYGNMPTVIKAGKYTVYYKVSADNHSDAFGSFEVTVGKITGIIIKTESFTKVYDGTPLSGSNVITFVTGLNKFVAGDNAVLAEAATITNVGSVDNTPVIKVTSATLGDVTECYDITFSGEATLTVTPAPITITANDNTITYGEAPTHDNYTITGLPENGTITGEPVWTYTYEQYGAVGNTYKIQLSGLGAGDQNYTISYVDGTLTVEPKKITVNATNQTITYGDSAKGGYEADGLVNGDTLDVKYTFTNDAGVYGTTNRNVGTYTITITSATNANYTVTIGTAATMTVEKRAITVAANNASIVFGEAPIHADYRVTLGDLVDDDTLYITFAVDYKQYGDVGTYTIYVADGFGSDITENDDVIILGSDNLGNDMNANYDITFENGELTVNPKEVTVTANDIHDYVYGTTAPTYGFTVEGLIEGYKGTVEEGNYFTSVYTNESPVADYSITATNTDGLVVGNYKLNFVGATLKVINANFEASVDNYEAEYKGDAHTVVADTNKHFSNIINGQTVTFKFYSDEARENEITETINADYVNVQNVTVYFTASAPNHNDVKGAFTVTIKATNVIPSDVTVEIVYNNNNIVYDGDDHIPEIGTITIAGVQVEFTFTQTAYTNAGTYYPAITITSGNYEGAVVNNIAWTILPYTVTDVKWTIGEYTYNGSAQAPTVIGFGPKGETIALVGSSEIYVGTHESVVTGFADAQVENIVVGNYRLNKLAMDVAYFTIEESTPVKIYSASVTIGSEYAINFKVLKEAMDQYGYDVDPTVASLVFSRPGYADTVAEVTDEDGSVYYVFTFTNVGPQSMGIDVTATLTVKSDAIDTAKVDARTYSIADYCYNMLAKNAADEELSTVLVNMLYYGAEAQKADGQTSGFVTDALTEDQQALRVQRAEYKQSPTNANRDAAHVSGIGNNVWMDNGAAIVYMIKLADTEANIEDYVLTVNGTAVAAEDVVWSYSNGAYSCNIDINMFDCDVVYTIALEFEGTVVATRDYSVETYAGKNTDATLVRSLVDFSYVLKAYMGN